VITPRPTDYVSSTGGAIAGHGTGPAFDRSGGVRGDLVALERYAEPAEIAEIVLFLASERASYVTGSVDTAEAGMTGM
jgi:NAD(P)-dependent dehydrogenase (short-subunit alcohol dehydrogenase family)